jgi:hypothetical protein
MATLLDVALGTAEPSIRKSRSRCSAPAGRLPDTSSEDVVTGHLPVNAEIRRWNPSR